MWRKIKKRILPTALLLYDLAHLLALCKAALVYRCVGKGTSAFTLGRLMCLEYQVYIWIGIIQVIMIA